MHRRAGWCSLPPLTAPVTRDRITALSLAAIAVPERPVILGLGIDIVDIGEFRAGLTEALKREVFLPDEMAYAESRARPWESYAVRFAAKEAAMKALGAGLAQAISWKDVELVRLESGELELLLHGRARARAEEKGVSSSRVSVSHSRASAAAVVVLEG